MPQALLSPPLPPVGVWSALLLQAEGSALQELGAELGPGEVARWLHLVLTFSLFPVGDHEVTLTTAILVGVMIVATWWISHILQRTLDRAFRARSVEDPGTTQVAKRLLHYGVMAVGLSSPPSRTTRWRTPSSGSGREWGSTTTRTCVRSGALSGGRRRACRGGWPSGSP
jgi:hypothetical protein